MFYLTLRQILVQSQKGRESLRGFHYVHLTQTKTENKKITLRQLQLHQLTTLHFSLVSACNGVLYESAKLPPLQGMPSHIDWYTNTLINTTSNLPWSTTVYLSLVSHGPKPVLINHGFPSSSKHARSRQPRNICNRNAKAVITSHTKYVTLE